MDFDRNLAFLVQHRMVRLDLLNGSTVRLSKPVGLNEKAQRDHTQQGARKMGRVPQNMILHHRVTNTTRDGGVVSL
jgi:hypothetical protein